jgi:hypothetical protein
MKIRWSFFFFLFFKTKIKKNFISRFVSISELELFLLTGVLTPNFNTMDLVKKFEKNQSGHIEGDVMQNHEQK